MKKIFSTILVACAFAACSAKAGELRVLASTPTGDKAYIIPVDGSLAPTVNLAVPRNTQSLMIGYVPAPQPEPIVGIPMEPVVQAEEPRAVTNVTPVEETPVAPQDTVIEATPVAASAPAEEKKAPAKRVRPYVSAKAGFGFFKIRNISMTTRVATYDYDYDPITGLPPTLSSLPGVAWLENSTVAAEGGNKPRGIYAYAAGLELPVRFGSFRMEFEYNESDNHIYDLYGDSSSQPMRLTLAPMTRFLNLYWDWPGFYRKDDGGAAVRPYFGVGLGISAIRAHAVWEDDAIGAVVPDTKFYTDTRTISRDKAYNYNAGVAFAIGEHLALDFGYRHVNYGKIRGTTENFFTYVDVDYGAGKPVSLSDVELKTRANEYFGGIRLSI